MTEEERIKGLMEIIELSKSGWAGVLPNGNIVDRRLHPNAIPVQKSSVFGTPTPSKLPE